MNDDRVARYQDLRREYQSLRLPEQSIGPRMERLEWIAYVARTMRQFRHDERALTGLWYTLEMALTSLDGDEQP